MRTMTTIKNIFLLSLISFLCFSCTKSRKASFSDDKDIILKLHFDQRNYHFNKDSIAFANQFSDNFISVNKGIISMPKKEETISRYNGYFSSVETAFTSLSPGQINALAENRGKRGRLVRKLTERHDILLTTLLIGNNLANLGASALTTAMTIRIYLLTYMSL